MPETAFFQWLPSPLAIFLSILVLLFLGHLRMGLMIWTIAILAMAIGWGAPIWVLASLVIILLLLNIPGIRTALISRPLMMALDRMGVMPKISETEKIALEAGTTWVDAELFSGSPNFDRILSEPYPQLTQEEQAFLDGPTQKLCAMINDWEVFRSHDLSQETWEFMKEQKFFGLHIPKRYGGLEFSALAHSAIVAKIGSRSVTATTTVMVPNSLGPAELLLHYGTDAQKDYYLPRLARGEEVPCFALTEPKAGSDAGSLQSEAIVFRGEDGKLYLRLNFEKRYITLAAVATLVGLAVNLKDPDNLLGKGPNPGITCVLVPHDAKGIDLGMRHNPMGIPFYNCPIKGIDVVVSIDQIIGGAQGAGQGWRMLMECLAEGRSISLPAMSAGGVKLAARVVSAYAGIRKQFGISIDRMEGVAEVMGRIGGNAYMIEAMRIFTAGAVDAGLKPAVISAIAKYQSTETLRRVVNDGMDVMGGAGISRGPSNLLGNSYISLPIGITVEGANILTRTMIIFGQGALRCHPCAYHELRALADRNATAFDRAFFSHLGFVIQNLCRSILLSLSRGYLAKVPGTAGPLKRDLQKIAWVSAVYAFMSDLAMGTLGGALKKKERLTGRYADILSWMFIASSVVRRFIAEGSQKEHLPFVRWALDHSFAEMQRAFTGIFRNFDVPIPGVRFLLRLLFAPYSHFNSLGSGPDDRTVAAIARALSKPGPMRDLVTSGIYLPGAAAGTDRIGRFELAFASVVNAASLSKKIRQGVREKKIEKKIPWTQQIAKAVELGILTPKEAEAMREAETLREEVIRVDSFRLEEFSTGLLEGRT